MRSSTGHYHWHLSPAADPNNSSKYHEYLATRSAAPARLPPVMAAPAPMPQPTQYVGDQNVEGVREEFERFLLNFSPAGYDPAQPMADEDAPPAPSSFMAQQVLKMCADGETTLYIEYAHLREHNAELADKVVVHFERAEPVLRKVRKAK